VPLPCGIWIPSDSWCVRPRPRDSALPTGSRSSLIKAEVHNISQRRQSWTKPQPCVTRTIIWWRSGVGFRIYAGGEAHRQTNTLITILRRPRLRRLHAFYNIYYDRPTFLQWMIFASFATSCNTSLSLANKDDYIWYFVNTPVPSVNYSDGLGRCFSVFMLVLLCFCVAAVFRWTKIYIFLLADCLHDLFPGSMLCGAVASWRDELNDFIMQFGAVRQCAALRCIQYG